MSKNTKKNIIKFFKELYNREPNEEELKAFMEYMRVKRRVKGEYSEELAKWEILFVLKKRKFTFIKQIKPQPN